MKSQTVMITNGDKSKRIDKKNFKLEKKTAIKGM